MELLDLLSVIYLTLVILNETLFIYLRIEVLYLVYIAFNLFMYQLKLTDVLKFNTFTILKGLDIHILFNIVNLATCSS